MDQGNESGVTGPAPASAAASTRSSPPVSPVPQESPAPANPAPTDPVPAQSVRAEPSPAERAAEITPVAVGTAVWALLFVIGLFIRDELAAGGREWWIWACAAGVGLGLVGYLYLWRRWARRTTSSPDADPDQNTGYENT